jgi:hypothetical protein
MVQDTGGGQSRPYVPNVFWHTRVRRIGSRTRPLLRLLADARGGDPEAPVRYFGTIEDSDPSPAAGYVIRILAAGSTDLAGNPLDGEFRGAYPTGNGRPGGDFVLRVGGSSGNGRSGRR